MSEPASGFVANLFALAERIEYSAVGVAIGESRYGYAVIEGIHLIGLAVALGLPFAIDLRLLGLLLRDVPVADLMRQLRPWVTWGFVAIFVTGGLLFWSSASRMLESPAFVIKLGLMVLAGLNALYFELVAAKTTAIRNNQPEVSRQIRFAGVASLTLWTLVIASGRLISYLPRWS